MGAILKEYLVHVVIYVCSLYNILSSLLYFNLHFYNPVSVICSPDWVDPSPVGAGTCSGTGAEGRHGENSIGEVSGLVADLVSSSSAFITYPVNACNFPWETPLCHHQRQKKLSCEVGTWNNVFQLCVSYQLFSNLLVINFVQFFIKLEGTARYAGLLLAPAEGFGLRPRLFLPFGQKKSFSRCLCLF